MEIKRILVPTDFSEGSRAALPYALDLARRYDAAIHLLHVIYAVEKEMYWYPTQIKLDEFYRELEDNAEEEFGKYITEDFEGYEKIEKVILKGLPYEAILDYITEHDIDLVIMGTHGRTGLERVLFGSTVSKVVKHSPCPVLSVRIPKEKG